MLVGYAVAVPTDNAENYEWRVQNVRNITVKIGCSCIYHQPVMVDTFVITPQKKRSLGLTAKENLKKLKKNGE